MNHDKEINEHYFNKIKRETLECLQALSTYGLRNLFGTNYNILRLKWLILTIFLVAFQPILLVKHYLNILNLK